MKLAITGATGFVGAHLARHLIGLGEDVHLLSRPDSDTARLADVQDAVVMHLADLREPALVAAVVEAVRPDRVFHLAAATMHAGTSPGADDQVTTNLRGTVALMDACKDLPLDAFVNIGDAFEYGPGNGPIAENAPCHPTSLDGITKLAATLYGCALAASAGPPIVTVRPFSIVGLDDDPRRLVPRLVDSARAGAPIALSDRRIVRDFVSVKDAIEMFLLAADQADALRGAVLNCGSGAATTLGELVAAVERVAGVTVDAGWGAFPLAAHDLEHPIADITAATAALGWRPSTSLDEMIEQLWVARGPSQSAEDGSGSESEPSP